jgi:hypothetical protein
MCLTVWIGSSLPLVFDPPDAAEGSAVVTADPVHPRALEGFAHIGVVASWHGGAATCSCVFQEESLPWEARPESPETLQAFARLRREVERQLAAGAEVAVFAAWTDQEDAPPALCWRLAPGQLEPGHQLFQAGHLMPGGMPPDTCLLEFAPGLAAPEHEVRDVS